MLPDAVEYDPCASGVRCEGTDYGVRAFLSTLANALGIAVSGWVLTLLGDMDKADQTPAESLRTRVLTREASHRTRWADP
jgi:Na+/melibiose symporter-like transporter